MKAKIIFITLLLASIFIIKENFVFKEDRVSTRDCLLKFNPSKEILTRYDSQKSWLFELVKEQPKNRGEILNTFDYIPLISWYGEKRCKEYVGQIENNLMIVFGTMIILGASFILMIATRRED